MKWKNIDIGATYYHITGTFTEWSALFRSKQVREIVCDEVEQAMKELVVHLGDW